MRDNVGAIISTAAYQYAEGNYLAGRSENGLTTTYSWGDCGEQLSKSSAAVTEYVYDARRTMTQVKVSGSSVANYEYDALGRRIKTVEGGVTTITLYSGNDVVYEVETPPTGPATTTTYLALNGQYLAKTVREGLDQPQTFFFHTDLVGSVRAVTDSTGQLVARFEYEPFGLTTLASGALANETHKFTGKPEDGTGLYYFGARYYDPEVGRFTASDPARQGLNWYAYCSNSPLCYIDPDGQFIMSAIGAGALWLSQYLVNIWNSLYLAGIDAMAVISSPAFPLLVEAASTPAEPTRSDTGGPTGGNGNGGRPPFMPDLGSVPLAEVVRQAMDRIAKNDEMQKHIMYGSKRAAGSLEHSWEKLVGNAPTWEQVAKVSAGLHANVSAAIGVINGLEVEIRVFCNTPGVWLVNDAWVRF